MNTEQKILIAIKRQKSSVMVRANMNKFGSRSNVDRALRNLIARGKVVRLGYGVYARTRASSITGNPVPDGVLQDMAGDALEQMGVEFYPGRDIRRYNSGETTQVPWRITFNTNGRRINRALRWRDEKVFFENEKITETE